jgi:hypothetical protein
MWEKPSREPTRCVAMWTTGGIASPASSQALHTPVAIGSLAMLYVISSSNENGLSNPSEQVAPKYAVVNSPTMTAARRWREDEGSWRRRSHRDRLSFRWRGRATVRDPSGIPAAVTRAA